MSAPFTGESFHDYDEVDVTLASRNNKVTKPMIFDTGAALTMIPARLAEEIGLKPSQADPDIRCETADGTVVVLPGAGAAASRFHES